MEYEKYIVPIYTSQESKTEPDENDFNGNGIIIGKFLITAGHVVMNDDIPVNTIENVWFKYNNVPYKLSESPIYYEYDKPYQVIGCSTLQKLDLAIYVIETEINSPIEFVNDTDDYKYRDCSYYGYTMNEDSNQLDFDVVDQMQVYLKATERRGDCCYYIDNCYEVTTNYLFKKGNSGGSIFQNDRFVGLFVALPYDENHNPLTNKYRCVSAKYINNIIQSLQCSLSSQNVVSLKTS
ncbi:MAG: hypothetical protein J6T70_15505 [Bacteroidales bacterium]|nr:hypothetical protein [Bacteroidales bacterium]